MPATHEPATPYHRVDVARLERNVRRVADAARTSGVALRPHAKTHKSAEVVRLQLEAGARGITVATVAEAEAFVAAGVDDVFVAYPLWTDDTTGRRLRALVDRARVGIGVDSAEGASALARRCGADVEVLVEVDSGHHRTGVPPEDAGAVAAAAVRSGLTVRGVFTFPGHSYAPGLGAATARDEREALAAAAASLDAAGVEPAVVSGGSTPSLADSLATPGALTELRPGVYVFGDAQQWELGAHRPRRRRPHLPRHGGQPGRWTRRPRRRQQGPRRRPARRGPPAGAAWSTAPTPGWCCSRSTTPSSTGAAATCRPWGRRSTSCPTTAARRSTSPTGSGPTTVTAASSRGRCSRAAPAGDGSTLRPRRETLRNSP